MMAWVQKGSHVWLPLVMYVLCYIIPCLKVTVCIIFSMWCCTKVHYNHLQGQLMQSSALMGKNRKSYWSHRADSPTGKTKGLFNAAEFCNVLQNQAVSENFQGTLRQVLTQWATKPHQPNHNIYFSVFSNKHWTQHYNTSLQMITVPESLLSATFTIFTQHNSVQNNLFNTRFFLWLFLMTVIKSLTITQTARQDKLKSTVEMLAEDWEWQLI